MNEKIKEILNQKGYSNISGNQKKILLDYITELEEEIERQSKAQVILDNENAELYGEVMELREYQEKNNGRKSKSNKHGRDRL